MKKIKILLTGLPAAAGVYLYFDKNDVVIYVGKAKNIKKRVSSYFSSKHTDIKTRRLIDSIIDIQYFIVSTESDALLLENNLRMDLEELLFQKKQSLK